MEWKGKNPYSKHHCQACEIDRVTACSGCVHDAFNEGAQDQAKRFVAWLGTVGSWVPVLVEESLVEEKHGKNVIYFDEVVWQEICRQVELEG